MDQENEEEASDNQDMSDEEGIDEAEEREDEDEEEGEEEISESQNEESSEEPNTQKRGGQGRLSKKKKATSRKLW